MMDKVFALMMMSKPGYKQGFKFCVGLFFIVTPTLTMFVWALHHVGFYKTLFWLLITLVWMVIIALGVLILFSCFERD